MPNTFGNSNQLTAEPFGTRCGAHHHLQTITITKDFIIYGIKVVQAVNSLENKTGQSTSKWCFTIFCNSWWKTSFSSLAVATYPLSALLSRKGSFDLHRATNRAEHEKENWGAWDLQSQMTRVWEPALIETLQWIIPSAKCDEAEGCWTSAENEFSAVSQQSSVSLQKRKAIRIALVIISNNHNKIHLNW